VFGYAINAIAVNAFQVKDKMLDLGWKHHAYGKDIADADCSLRLSDQLGPSAHGTIS